MKKRKSLFNGCELLKIKTVTISTDIANNKSVYYKTMNISYGDTICDEILRDMLYILVNNQHIKNKHMLYHNHSLKIFHWLTADTVGDKVKLRLETYKH